MIKRYCFTRRAKNESNSGRTAKIGSIKGTFAEAINKALELYAKEGVEITVHDHWDSVIVARINMYAIKNDSYIQMLAKAELLAEVLKS